ncbi:MAG: rhodanese-like domain-containing protein [Streptosporangiaceae bacterium]
MLLGGLGSYPPYFLRLREVNRRGPAVYGIEPPRLGRLGAGEVGRLAGDGALIVDVRPVAAFAAGHVPGSLSVPLREAFATWLGWLADPGRRWCSSPARSAVETDRIVPPSGNLQIGGQQVWLGPALAGRMVTLWVDETSLHSAAGRHPGQDPAVPARGDRAGPAGRRWCPSRRSLPAADRDRRGDRGRSHGQRQRAGGPVRRAGQRRPPAGRAAGHAADGRAADGRHRLRRDAAAHHDLPHPAQQRYRLRGARRAALTQPRRPAVPSRCSGGCPPAAGSWSPARRSRPG